VTFCALAVDDDVQCYFTVPNPFPLILLAYVSITSLYSSNTK